MTKRRAWVVAGVVGLLGVVALVYCGAPFWLQIPVLRDVWLSIAYERFESKYSVYVKRADWIPGDQFVRPHQPCGYCKRGQHQKCVVGWEFIEEGTDGRPGFVLTESAPFSSRCTCPDASHKDKP